MTGAHRTTKGARSAVDRFRSSVKVARPAMNAAHRATRGARSAVKLASGHLTRAIAIDPSAAENLFRRVDQLPGMAIEPGE
jgi:hypothetical protein